MRVSEEDRHLIDQLHQVADLKAALEQMLTTVRQYLSRIRQYDSHLDRIYADRTRAFPWLAGAIAQYHELCDLKVAELLERKLRPAVKSGERVRSLAREKRKFHRMFRIARNRVRYYESLFPWLKELVGEDLDDLVAAAGTESPDGGNEDPVSKYLTQAEYHRLGTAERNQLALDRYRRGRKHPWQIGRDYERYVGYKYESLGYEVAYHGIVEGLGDLGRDLIAKKDGLTEIVQCKCWRPERKIHEKHLFQLFGTVVEYWLKMGKTPPPQQLELFPAAIAGSRVKAVLITSTRLSEKAHAFARALGVKVLEELSFDPEYPCIKCNVSRRTGDKIYHLPMDQQYDNVLIEGERNERYVRTVGEAERLGFRRAWRWHGKEKEEPR